jgi:hypothetical protein
MTEITNLKIFKVENNDSKSNQKTKDNDNKQKMLKSVRIDVSILERIKDMVYFESKKGNKILEQDAFENALLDYLTKNGY